jgi:cellulose synthase/poly-beta-1,6-N-acetylglucosamine synthase-like glycosyltransferase
MLSTTNGHDTREVVENLMRQMPGPREDQVASLQKLLGEPACRQLGIYPIPEGFKLSVVIPVYNEERWIREVVRRVREVPIPKEIIIVEDCSTDKTREVLKELQGDDLRIFYQPHNQGKGPPCVAASRRRRATLSSCRTPTWNTTPRSIRA